MATIQHMAKGPRSISVGPHLGFDYRAFDTLVPGMATPPDGTPAADNPYGITLAAGHCFDIGNDYSGVLIEDPLAMGEEFNYCTIDGAGSVILNDTASGAACLTIDDANTVETLILRNLTVYNAATGVDATVQIGQNPYGTNDSGRRWNNVVLVNCRIYAVNGAALSIAGITGASGDDPPVIRLVNCEVYSNDVALGLSGNYQLWTTGCTFHSGDGPGMGAWLEANASPSSKKKNAVRMELDGDSAAGTIHKDNAFWKSTGDKFIVTGADRAGHGTTGSVAGIFVNGGGNEIEDMIHVEIESPIFDVLLDNSGTGGSADKRACVLLSGDGGTDDPESFVINNATFRYRVGTNGGFSSKDIVAVKTKGTNSVASKGFEITVTGHMIIEDDSGNTNTYYGIDAVGANDVIQHDLTYIVPAGGSGKNAGASGTYTQLTTLT